MKNLPVTIDPEIALIKRGVLAWEESFGMKEHHDPTTRFCFVLFSQVVVGYKQFQFGALKLTTNAVKSEKHYKQLITRNS